MTKELTLKKPILAHNEKLHVLELREPTYDEIEAIGFPFTVSGDGTIKLDSAVALKYIPVLAGILVHLQRRWQSWIFLKPVCKFSVFLPSRRRIQPQTTILQRRLVLEIKPP